MHARTAPPLGDCAQRASDDATSQIQLGRARERTVVSAVLVALITLAATTMATSAGFSSFLGALSDEPLLVSMKAEALPGVLRRWVD